MTNTLTPEQIDHYLEVIMDSLLNCSLSVEEKNRLFQKFNDGQMEQADIQQILKAVEHDQELLKDAEAILTGQAITAA